MAITLWKTRDIYNNPDHKEFLIDSTSDLQYLPTSSSNGTGIYTLLSKCAIGSLAVIPDGDIYVLKNNNTWGLL